MTSIRTRWPYGANPPGGYLAAMAGTTNGQKQFDVGGDLDESSDVQAVIDEFGPSDLSKLAADYDEATQEAKYRRGNPLAKFFIGPGTGLSALDDPAALRAADPATYISSRTPPFIELHGSHDRLSPRARHFSCTPHFGRRASRALATS